ncbi:RsmD family RNA methyltransferase [Robertkochia flava]|uniref:RsmD family RNA methyltransferase n=1 Tax=Robertkochia flava TaxID=3447986 RepID=UPI001CCBBC48|nr:RsmD family RNA methyltransferase [Robertkochia marina]
MRIISGKHKSKRLVAPKKLPVRPTTDFAKEALFNVLNNHYYLDELTVIDLFSGTGNISYELASRGCTDITAVDSHPGCVQFISKTSQELDMNIKTVRSDVFKFLERTLLKVDLIFADPPYDMPEEDMLKIPQIAFDRALLLPGGMLVVEHSKHTDLSKDPHFSDSRRYGGSVFSFFENPEEEEDTEA